MSALLSLKKNVLVPHPSGADAYGTVPEMANFQLRGGEIYLRVGEHFRDGSGFGVRHIWEAHKKDLAPYGCTAIDDVPKHIANMIVPGASIYCEFREMTGEHRLTVLKSPKGLLILQPRQERRGFGYYIVTWYPKRKADGTLVGKILRPK